jgi:glycosyltransferase involved in cell wall biosynthesis
LEEGEVCRVDISVVIPVYNEVENLSPLHSSLTEALRGKHYELIFVDDGSTDGSQEQLGNIVDLDPEHSRAIILRRNFGQTAAIAAGIDHSFGDVIVTIDADQQNDPGDIPLLMRLKRGMMLCRDGVLIGRTNLPGDCPPGLQIGSSQRSQAFRFTIMDARLRPIKGKFCKDSDSTERCIASFQHMRVWLEPK